MVRFVGFFVLAAALLFSTAALAATLPGQENSQNGSSGHPKLQAAKLKVCQTRERNIKNRSVRLEDLVRNMESKFDTTEKRVEDYYTNTVIPSGKTVANYDALISDIQAKKAVVQSALTKTQTDFNGFSCTANDPKGSMTQFRQNMQAAKQALGDYRTSIKNLIVAVRSVTGVENQQNPNIPANTNPGNGGQ